MMPAMGTPANERLFVAPGRQRDQPAFIALALETLVVDEPLDGLELGLELLGEGEIVVKTPGLGLHLEDDGEHVGLLSVG